ncbi:class A sortase [Bacillus paralicheniformis]|uniref:class A sortase n=1 Tax=Bacillus TaxID=1386 RepID=UPI0013EE76F5|nr:MULTISPECIES: class A sortase [Bacillus]QII26958.1 class A sortase [Bacillus altitudinis]QII51426.1 class A sortase [Bacillus paralicheniformis]
MKRFLWLLIITIFFTTGFNLLLQPENPKKYEKLESNSKETLTLAKMDVADKDIGKQVKENDELEDGVSGMVSIPSLDINLAIIEGSTKENLYKGATTLKDHQRMGEGNYSLAGHHMKDESLFFGRLEEIKYGAKVLLTDKETIYIYQINNKKTVHETQIDILNDHPNKTELTLITCDRPTSTEYRTVVTGNLVKEIKYSDETWKERTQSKK